MKSTFVKRERMLRQVNEVNGESPLEVNAESLNWTQF